MDEIELEEVEESTGAEEELQNEEETGYEKFPLAEASENIRWNARGLASVSTAWLEQRGRGEGKRGGRGKACAS